MIKTEIKIDTKKWDKLKTQIKDLNSVYTTCGLHEDEKYDVTLFVAYIGAIQDFGLPNKKPPIPSRPWMRSWFDKNLKNIKEKTKKILENILDGYITVKEGIEQLGFYGSTELKQSIVKWSMPPNAPLTILLKGFNDPLIDTGQMRDTVNHKEHFNKPFPKGDENF